MAGVAFMKRWVWAIVIGGAAVIVVGLLLPLGGMVWYTQLNHRDKELILPALKETYPEVEFGIGCAYDCRRLYVAAFDVTDLAKQAEIRDWLDRFKANHGLGAEIWCLFSKERISTDRKRSNARVVDGSDRARRSEPGQRSYRQDRHRP